MKNELFILIAEAIGVYFLVLWAHSLRSRAGLAHFYALIGGLTAVMSWVTDAGVRVNLPHVSLLVGSTVFYTALLLGVFVVYVFDGPRATRVAISTIAGVSIMVPIIALVLHMQIKLSDSPPIGHVPSQLAHQCRLGLRHRGRSHLSRHRLGIPRQAADQSPFVAPLLSHAARRDVAGRHPFFYGAFLGTPAYAEIVTGTLLSRLIISVFAYPFLYLYLKHQNKKFGMVIEHRPVLAILKEVTEVRLELTLAQQKSSAANKWSAKRKASSKNSSTPSTR